MKNENAINASPDDTRTSTCVHDGIVQSANASPTTQSEAPLLVNEDETVVKKADGAEPSPCPSVGSGGGRGVSELCKYFIQGVCYKGAECRFAHDKDKRAETRREKQKLRRKRAREGNATHPTSRTSTGGEGIGARSYLEVDAEHEREEEERRTKAMRNNKRGLYLPPPLESGKGRGSLLRRLVEDEVQAEESLVLQCLRFFVQSHFFDKALESERDRVDPSGDSPAIVAEPSGDSGIVEIGIGVN